MADMTFNGKQLTWGAHSWDAQSGPFGRGALPAGTYRVERRRVTSLSSSIGRSFQEPGTGQGFFVPITPQDEIGRTGLGIHPDGGRPGTDGCIGLRSDSTTFYQKLGKTAPNAVLTLEVRN